MTYFYKITIFLIKLFLTLAGPLTLLRKYPTALGAICGVLITIINIKILYFYNEPWAGVLADAISQLINNGDNYFYPEKKVELLKQQDTKLLDFFKKSLVWGFVGGLTCVGLLNVFFICAGINLMLLETLIQSASGEAQMNMAKALIAYHAYR